MKNLLLLSMFVAWVAATPIVEPDSIESYVIGGANAPASGISYQVTFRTILTLHWCGGSIVNARWVLSAAHCLDARAPSSITVMVGSNLLDSGGAFHQAQSIRLHPSYNRNTFANDVAVLQVTTPFVWNARVQPVVLGSAFVGGGVNARFTGWGHTNQQGARPNHLQVVTLSTITNADCINRLAVRGEERFVVNTKICTFTRVGQGSCPGDSGGPLVTGTNTQIGILSWGVLPCGSGFPDGFDRVSDFRTWIINNTPV
ncbi:CLUMA_CG018891, isoform A [Clunio marinus]|uniref:CLUMA_CG018891, isoform A n=1 Tax=Clunio marinus TaxID=568069 RepID=A0A1J1J113_9DIPT|nr:CLUMA_CG018891, isoform A [Clunio marinus]